jgi:hypothetical protein
VNQCRQCALRAKALSRRKPISARVKTEKLVFNRDSWTSESDFPTVKIVDLGPISDDATDNARNTAPAAHSSQQAPISRSKHFSRRHHHQSANANAALQGYLIRIVVN